MLANELGWLDVDEMLDNMTREQFEERYALYALHEEDPAWQQAGTVAAACINAIREFLACQGLAYFKRISLPEDHIPKYRTIEEVEEDVANRNTEGLIDVEAMEAQFAARYGVG